MKQNTESTDVVIIGSGPVGLFTIFECGMLNLKCHVVDTLESIGGQCQALYPEKPIYDIPAYPTILAGDLIDQLEKQANPFQPVYHLGQQVTQLNKQGSGWLVTTSKNTTISCQAVIIAGGGGAFGPNKPPIDNLSVYEGRSVFYMVRTRKDFAGKKIVIAGGGDSAVDWAISLSELADKLYLVHRRDKFRAAPDSLAKLSALSEQGKIEMVTPYQLKSLDGKNGQLASVCVADLDGSERTLEADILLPFFGLAMDIGPIAAWNLELEHNHIVVDPATSQTNQSGIYAVGDIATYPNKLKLILTGFSEAAMAAHAIYRQIHPDTELHMEYSTTKGLPTS